MSIYDKENEQEAIRFAFGKVGDQVSGTLVEKKQVKTKFGLNWLYTIKADDGFFHALKEDKTPEDEQTDLIAGDYVEVFGKKVFNGVMNRMKIGQKVAVRLIEEKPVEKGTMKIIKVFTEKEMDQDWMNENSEDRAPESEGGEEVDF